MKALELEDIQGIIVRGYGDLRAARFLLLEIREPVAARRWVQTLAEEVMDATTRPSAACCNVAFSHQGLRRLGLGQDALDSFRLEFRDGMTGSEHTRRALGDVGTSSPEHWSWGGPDSPQVHALLLLYAADQEQLESYHRSHQERFDGGAVTELTRLDTFRLPGRKEHFGFRDGIAQPVIAGYKEGPEDNTVSAGEFIFGYPDEYGALPPTPTVDPASDAQQILAEARDGDKRRDLGRNGSYLVFRQLSQDVHAFWRFVNESSKSSGASDSEARVRLASKMVGRWPSGAPLLLAPDRDEAELRDADDFRYHSLDPHGLRCPFGSHVRRTNPRDSLEPKPGSEDSIKVGKRHRIIRRGRAYGPPVAPSMAPGDVLAHPPDDVERGLHFMCFNTNLERQFVFIQHTWINNKKFAGLYNDADPLMGSHDPKVTSESGSFTIPAQPVRRRLNGLPRFTQVRGGAYFFMPGKAALRYLAALG